MKKANLLIDKICILFSIILLVSLCLFASAESPNSGECGINGDNLIWSFEDGTLTVSGSGEMQYYNSSNLPWKSFASNIKYVVIENGVTSIGIRAFENCSELEAVFISNSVEYIASCAFYNCESIKEITIGTGTTGIGTDAFSGCTNLSKVNWNAIHCSGSTTAFSNAGSESNGIDFIFGDSVEEIPGAMFYYYETNNPKIVSLTIGKNVRKIGTLSFSNCIYLEKIYWNAENVISDSNSNYYFEKAGAASDGIDVVFGESVESIPSYLFYSYNGSDCANIRSVTIGNNVKSIGESAFYNCKNLTSVTISDGVINIEPKAFRGCRKLNNLIMGNSVETIGDEAFYSCGLKRVVVPASVLSIGERAFRGSDIVDLVLENGVKNIGGEAFYNCPGLTSITIPYTVETVDANAFSNCSNLKTINWNAKNAVTASGVFSKSGSRSSLMDVVFGNDVEIIPENMFNSSNVGTVTFGNNVKFIGEQAFYRCDYLSEVIIPDSVITIGARAFYYCLYLKDLTIGNGVKNIGASAFYECNNLKSINIPDSVEDIGGSAFSYCYYVTSLAVGTNVKNIGDYAFCGCYNLSSIYWNAKSPNDLNYSNSVFYDYSYLGNIEVVFGDDVEYIPANLFNIKGSPGLKEINHIVIGNNVKTIGDYAFYRCKGLTDISIPDSVESISTTAFGLCRIENMYIGKGINKFEKSGLCGNSVKNVVISEENPALKSVDGIVYSKDLSTIYYYPSGKTNREFTIPDGVKNVYSKCFYANDNFNVINMPKSVSYIGSDILSGTGQFSVYSIHYSGTKTDKEKIIIDENNSVLEKSNWYYTTSNSEEQNQDKPSSEIVAAKIIKGNSSNKVYKYRSTVTFYVDVTSDSVVQWYLNDKVVGNGNSLTVKESKENYSIKVVVTAKDGTRTTDSQNITIKSRFFDKLVSFFVLLFDKDAYTYEQK